MLALMDNDCPEMLPAELSLWREFVARRCGLAYSDTRCRVLRQSLWQRMTGRGIHSYSDYYHHVVFHPAGEQEWQQLLPTLLNHETSFFRHGPSFTALTTCIIPRLMRERGSGVEPLRIWSAGCSSGQEPFSLAIAMLETINVSECPLELFASDLSEAILARARQGCYTARDIRSLPVPLDQKYLRPLANTEPKQYRIADSVRTLVRFSRFNLTEPGTYDVPLQDVIFCHNVLIYFQPAIRVAVIQHLGHQLTPNGYLFLAPADALGLEVLGLEQVRMGDALIYRRKAMIRSKSGGCS